MSLRDGLQVGDLADPVRSRADQDDLRVLVHSLPEGRASCALCTHMGGRSEYTTHRQEFDGRTLPGNVFSRLQASSEYGGRLTFLCLQASQLSSSGISDNAHIQKESS